jgi:hypothetical protein
MTLRSLKARQKPPKRAWRHDQRIRARSMATTVATDNFDDLSRSRPRIAWQPLLVVKPGPCRLRNFASG